MTINHAVVVNISTAVSCQQLDQYNATVTCSCDIALLRTKLLCQHFPLGKNMKQ